MTTCARCRAETGTASHCPGCGQAVLSPQAGVRPITEQTDTVERPAVRSPVEPASATAPPAPAGYPLFADEVVESAPGRSGAPGWLLWPVVALLLVLIAAGGAWLLLSPGGDDPAGETASGAGATTQGSSKSSASATPPTSPAPTPTTSPSTDPTPAGDPVDPVEVAGGARARAPRSAPANVDLAGNRTTYVAANLLDGRPDTCWRMVGDGTGTELSLILAGPTTLSRVGLINGYAKTAVAGGRKLNWYVGNRRVYTVTWVFDDGTTVDQPLTATKKMQTIDIAPVTTSTVRLRLVSVSAPGTGRSARDYTAVSEVTLVGVPSA